MTKSALGKVLERIVCVHADLDLFGFTERTRKRILKRSYLRKFTLVTGHTMFRSNNTESAGTYNNAATDRTQEHTRIP